MLRLPSNWYYSDRRTYTEVFAITFLYNIGIVAAAVLAAFVICLITKLCLARRRANEQLKESILTSE
jgi:hypothetical protein